MRTLEKLSCTESFVWLPNKIWPWAAQVVSAVNGPGLLLQLNLVKAAKKAANPTLQFIPSEFSAFGAVGEPFSHLLLDSSN